MNSNQVAIGIIKAAVVLLVGFFTIKQLYEQSKPSKSVQETYRGIERINQSIQDYCKQFPDDSMCKD